MKRHQNTPQGVVVFGDGAADPRPSQKWQRHGEAGDVDATPPLELLPGELLLFLFRLLGDPAALVSISQTCRRHHALANDPTLWRSLCELRFGPFLLHRGFAAHGKC
nr:F-box incomplete domain containing protein [Pandoravirus aubagnensis]